MFEDYVDEVRRNNPHFVEKDYQVERKAWFSRSVPGDAGLKPSDFDFPFDPKNPPKVDDDRASDDE